MLAPAVIQQIDYPVSCRRHKQTEEGSLLAFLVTNFKRTKVVIRIHFLTLSRPSAEKAFARDDIFNQ